MADQSYDGIKYREEKKAPAVFRILFWGLVFWGVSFIGYFLFSGWSSQGEFEQKKKAREEQVAKGTPAAGAHREGKKEEYLAVGRSEFSVRCASCHGPDGKGVIGPDLTRKEYKYGKSRQAITESISNGRPGGMPAFGKEISHEKVEGLVEYLLSLKP